MKTRIFQRKLDPRERKGWAEEVARARQVVEGGFAGRSATELEAIGFSPSLTRSILLMAGANPNLTRLGRGVDWRKVGRELNEQGAQARGRGWPKLARGRAYELKKAWALVVWGVEAKGGRA